MALGTLVSSSQLSSVNTSVLEVYRSEPLAGSRKLDQNYFSSERSGSSIRKNWNRVGELQAVILDYAASVYPNWFTIPEIIERYWRGLSKEERLRLNKSLLRAAHSLAKRGFLEVSYIYTKKKRRKDNLEEFHDPDKELKKVRPLFRLKSYTNVVVQRTSTRFAAKVNSSGIAVAQGSSVGVSGRCDGGCVVRVHASFSRSVAVSRAVEEYFVRVYVYGRLLGYLAKWLEGYLRSRGWSRYRLKKLERFARRVAEEVKRRSRILFGIHGFRLRYRDGGVKHFSRFMPLELFESLIRREYLHLLELYELGIDMVIDGIGGAIGGGAGLGIADLRSLLGFVKIYTKKLSSLDSYAAG